MSVGVLANLLLQARNFLDLILKTGDFSFQKRILALLPRNFGLVPGIDGSAEQAANKGSNTQGDEKGLTAALARRFAVGKQIDQNHWKNLRKASPQAVR